MQYGQVHHGLLVPKAANTAWKETNWVCVNSEIGVGNENRNAKIRNGSVELGLGSEADRNGYHFQNPIFYASPSSVFVNTVVFHKPTTIIY